MKRLLIVVLVFMIGIVAPPSAHAKQHKTKVQDTVAKSYVSSASDSLRSTNANKSSHNSTFIYAGIILIVLSGVVLYFWKRKHLSKKHSSIRSSHREESEQVHKHEPQPDIEVDTDFQTLDQILGISNDESISESEKELIVILLRSLNSYHLVGRMLSFSGIDGEKNKDLLLSLLTNAVVDDGGLIEFLQNWFVGSFKNEVVLLGAKKYTIEQLMADVSHEAFEEVDDEYMPEIEPLSVIFPKTDLKVYCNGHELHWYANASLIRVYQNLMNWSFAKHFVEMPKRHLQETIFTDAFFKEKVFHPNGSTNVADYVNASDVEFAESHISSKPTRRMKSSYVASYIDQQDVEIAEQKMAAKNRTKPPQKDIARRTMSPVIYSKGNKHKLGADSEPIQRNFGEYQEVASIKKVDTVEPIRNFGYRDGVGLLFAKALKGGIPIAVISEGYIYEGFTVTHVSPLGNLTDGHVYKGILKGGVALATVSDKGIFPGLFTSVDQLGYIRDGYICKYREPGKIVASYKGNNDHEALAAAFLLGLLS